MREIIKNLPHDPGVYHYFDASGRLLYIGKAKDLAKRVKSYFRFTPELGPNTNLSPRIRKMIDETISMHYIVVKSEHDALILENSLIKQLKPKYNILLRDDKTYPYIYIDYSKPYPRFEITRKVIDGKQIDYFGPYSSGGRDILNSVYELCKLVQKASCFKGKKACLFYQIDKCLAPCEKMVDPKVYLKIVAQARRYIEDKSFLIKALQARMEFYAEMLRFEEAQEIRDRIINIQKMEHISQIDLAKNSHYDIFAIDHNNHQAAIVRLFMRYGKIVSSSHDVIPIKESFDRDELYERLLLEYYKNEKPPIVAPILIAHDFETRLLVGEHLSTIFEKKAHIHIPKQGEKMRLIELAKHNAFELLTHRKKDEFETLGEAVQSLFGLENFPETVEVFDNSHLAGEATVGAMITCKHNQFYKSAYRHYHLDARDEYAQMRETLSRRIESFATLSPPDLWIIDGGQTLLTLAAELLASSGSYVDVIAISKEKIDAKSHRAKGKALDVIHTLNDTFRLQSSDTRLQWVQKLRDEAHRFAITFHKKTKLKRDQESKLLSLHGISEAKIKKLLKYFGTFEAIKNAPIASLEQLLNEKDAKIIKKLYE